MYEIFTHKNRYPDLFAVTINKSGRMSFSRSITEVLLQNGIEYVLLLWDKENLKVAIQRTSEIDGSAYHIVFNKKHNQSHVSTRAFLYYIKYDYSRTQSFLATWNQESLRIEITIGSN